MGPNEEKTITIKSCNCQRDILYYPSLFSIKTPRNKSTCSENAHRRGESQKVVAFSFYELSNEMYQKRKKTGKLEKSRKNYRKSVNLENVYNEKSVKIENVSEPNEEKTITIKSCNCQRDILYYPSLFSIKTPRNKS